MHFLHLRHLVIEQNGAKSRCSLVYTSMKYQPFSSFHWNWIETFESKQRWKDNQTKLESPLRRKRAVRVQISDISQFWSILLHMFCHYQNYVLSFQLQKAKRTRIQMQQIQPWSTKLVQHRRELLSSKKSSETYLVILKHRSRKSRKRKHELKLTFDC